ncbi:hypothetical protein ACN6A1_06000 [Myxococcus virescens]|uniref:hypothetical protein n=1 Tax=Myxococcus virescens TaxID=83456 RepID=UPI003DA64721
MSVLRLHGGSAAWVASAPIFDSVSLTLGSGFSGLAGANGASKATLLSSLAGQRAPHEGTVVFTPEHEGIDALAARDDGVAAALRGRLALDPSDLEHGSMLPPGERNRWQTSLGLLLSRSGRW